MKYPLWNCLSEMSQEALRDLMPDDWSPKIEDEEYLHLKKVTKEMVKKPRYKRGAR